MLARVWQGLLCAIAGLVIGFGEYILGGARWYSGVHSGQVHSSYFFYYTLIALQFILPVWIVFLILYVGFKDRLFRQWWVSLLIAVVLGLVVAVALIYGVFYPEHTGIWGPVSGPVMAARHYPFLRFAGRTVLAAVSMFLLGTVVARRSASNHAMQRTAPRSDA